MKDEKKRLIELMKLNMLNGNSLCKHKEQLYIQKSPDKKTQSDCQHINKTFRNTLISVRQVKVRFKRKLRT